MKTILDKQMYLDDISKIITFKFLNKPELLEMMSSGELELYCDGEKIITQGESTQAFFAVVRGSVEVNVTKSGCRDVYICTIGDLLHQGTSGGRKQNSHDHHLQSSEKTQGVQPGTCL